MPEMTDSRMARADTVRLERLRRRLSQEEVGQLCDPPYNQATISKAELGRGSDDVIRAIAKALRIQLPEAVT